MRKVAVISTWITFALYLYSAFILGTRSPGALGVLTLLPLVSLGTILAAHHTKPVGTAVLWTALVLGALWALGGLLVVVVSLGTGQPTVGWGLLIGLFTLVPGVTSATVLYRRRNESKQLQAAT